MGHGYVGIKKGNTKFEARNPRQILMTKTPNPNFEAVTIQNYNLTLPRISLFGYDKFTKPLAENWSFLHVK